MMSKNSQVEFEMSISHKDFLRTLHAVLEGAPHAVSGRVVHAKWPDRSVTIYLSPEGERDLGSLELPVTRVTLEFQNFSDEQRSRFMEAFREHYQRAGGP
jgi:hypothetical protein